MYTRQLILIYQLDKKMLSYSLKMLHTIYKICKHDFLKLQKDKLIAA